jgi:hypothetical protein
VGLLFISLLAQIAGAVFFFLDYSQYPTTKPPAVDTAAKSAPAPGGGTPQPGGAQGVQPPMGGGQPPMGGGQPPMGGGMAGVVK